MGFHQNVLVIVTDLMPEMAQHGAVGLAEVDSKGLAVGVQRLDQIDRDHPARVPDHHTLAAAVTGRQIKRSSGVEPCPRRIGRVIGRRRAVRVAP